MVIVNDNYNISAPLFLMFAEYLGYSGETIKWTDDWCFKKKKPEDWQIKFIEIEANVILKDAIKKYGQEKIEDLFEQLYDVILDQYDENIYATIKS